MGHAAFERSAEDRIAYRMGLKAQQELWASMASEVVVSFKAVEWNGAPCKKRRSSRAQRTNRRSQGTNPRALLPSMRG